MTDDELNAILLKGAADEATRLDLADNFALQARLPELNTAGLRAIFNAGAEWMREQAISVVESDAVWEGGHTEADIIAAIRALPAEAGQR